MAMAVRDTELNPVFTNQAFRNFYGHTEEYIRNTPRVSVLPEPTLALYANEIRPAMALGLTWEGTYDIRTEAKAMKTVWGRFTPVLNAKGSLTHIISIMLDSLDFNRDRMIQPPEAPPLNRLAENTQDFAFRIRLSDGRLDRVGSAIETITGYDRQALCDTSTILLDLIPDIWRDALGQWWQELKQGISRYEYRIPLTHKNGTRKWMHLRVKLLFDKMQNPVAVEGVVTSVTDRHKTEDALAAARKSLNFISNSTSDIFFRLKIPEGTYDYLSPSVERFSGFTLEEYEANPLLIREIIHPDWREYFQETWEEMLRGEVRPSYEFQYVHKSGEVRWANQRVIMHRDKDGRGLAIEGIATDITERKVAEEAARENENRFRALFEDSPISLWEEDLTEPQRLFRRPQIPGGRRFQAILLRQPRSPDQMRHPGESGGYQQGDPEPARSQNQGGVARKSGKSPDRKFHGRLHRGNDPARLRGPRILRRNHPPHTDRRNHMGHGPLPRAAGIRGKPFPRHRLAAGRHAEKTGGGSPQGLRGAVPDTGRKFPGGGDRSPGPRGQVHQQEDDRHIRIRCQ